MSMKKRLWWSLPLILLALAWWAADRLRPLADLRLPPDPQCDLASQACSLSLPGGDRLTLNMLPHPPVLMQPMAVEVVLTGPADAVWIDMIGLNMDMGPNRSELSPADEGLWKGQVILPVCSSAEMQWEARVTVLREGRRIAAPFPFTTRR